MVPQSTDQPARTALLAGQSQRDYDCQYDLANWQSPVYVSETPALTLNRLHMLKNLSQIEGRALRARDGTLGEVKDFFFDDRVWEIRYLVVETGAWLNSRRVLISPDALRPTESEPDVFPVELTMDEVRNSPELGADNPVAHRDEAALRSYYGWPSYWEAFAGIAAPIINTLGPGSLAMPDTVAASPADPHLRSANRIRGCDIKASDGSIGHVDDFLTDQNGWRLRYLVIDTGHWLPGRKVLVAPSWIRGVNWDGRTLEIGMTRASIEASPPYDSAASWNQEYIDRLHDYYGLPVVADASSAVPATDDPARTDGDATVSKEIS